MSNPIQEIEHEIKAVEQKVESAKKKFLQNRWVISSLAIGVVLVIAGGWIYFQSASTLVKIDTSQIVAPLIDLSPTVAGELKQVYVNPGDTVAANTVVAQVGDELIKTQIAGQIVSTQNDIGKIFNPGTPVVSMIDPGELRAVGTIDENSGLNKISVGQTAEFTVDAFGSKVYQGVVDEVNPTSNQSSVVFNISGSRQVQQFNVKIRFDQEKYPELRNGMSARITIFIK